jgi:hypothetical protein
VAEDTDLSRLEREDIPSGVRLAGREYLRRFNGRQIMFGSGHILQEPNGRRRWRGLRNGRVGRPKHGTHQNKEI